MADKESRAGRHYADNEILSYVNRVHAPHDEGLNGAFGAPDRNAMPAVQVGQQDGKLLELLMRLVGARNVVEVGTLAGYSAIRLARGVGERGRVFSLEAEPKYAEVARQNVAAAGLADRVEVLVGNAVDLLPELARKGPFDAVFIDADKGNYARYGAWAAENLRRGGLIIGDNAFLFGRLLDDSEEAASMRRFHEQAAVEFDTACLTSPDGMLIGIKR
jgi:predicted O-methyltransferase YrrM